MSAVKLTSLATSTLSLLLERQRLQASHPTLHLQQVTANLLNIQNGVISLRTASNDEAAQSLTAHYERLRIMLGEEEASKAGIHPILPPSPPPPPPPEHNNHHEPTFQPYTDDPYPYEDGLLLRQREIMDAQDIQLDHISSSLRRQHHFSLQIGQELEGHTELLDVLDTGMDRTTVRVSNARRELQRIAQRAKQNGSTVTIAFLILILLILIVVFKT